MSLFSHPFILLFHDTRNLFFLQGYGKADHSVTVEILKRTYKDYEISWSDDKK